MRMEIASSVADMCFALQQWEDAYSAMSEAMTAAEEDENVPFILKASNNMGAVLKQLGRWASKAGAGTACILQMPVSGTVVHEDPAQE